MDKPFEKWAPSEIARLRELADSLERALELYEAAHKDAQPTRESLPRVRMIRRRGGRKPGVKTQAIMGHIQEQADHGVSLQELYAFVGERGLDMKKNSVRSVVYFEKQKGRVVEQDGRYYPGGNGVDAAATGAEAGTAH